MQQQIIGRRTLLQRRQPDETYQYMLYMLSLRYAIYIAIHNHALLRKLISCFICGAMYTCHRTYFISDVQLSSPIGSSTISPSTGRYLASRVLECMYIVKQHRNCMLKHFTQWYVRHSRKCSPWVLEQVKPRKNLHLEVKEGRRYLLSEYIQ